jgi:hypothetical protein
MKKSFKNLECELSGSLITIRENGELRKAYEVNPLNAIAEFNKACLAVKAVSSKVK